MIQGLLVVKETIGKVQDMEESAIYQEKMRGILVIVEESEEEREVVVIIEANLGEQMRGVTTVRPEETIVVEKGMVKKVAEIEVAKRGHAEIDVAKEKNDEIQTLYDQYWAYFGDTCLHACTERRSRSFSGHIAYFRRSVIPAQLRNEFRSTQIFFVSITLKN